MKRVWFFPVHLNGSIHLFSLRIIIIFFFFARLSLTVIIHAWWSRRCDKLRSFQCVYYSLCKCHSICEKKETKFCEMGNFVLLIFLEIYIIKGIEFEVKSLNYIFGIKLFGNCVTTARKKKKLSIVGANWISIPGHLDNSI